jgi:ABC-2 type transport system ATP-binding protein
MIQATDLHKSYGTLKAVDGVSFTMKQGETFGLLGPNGAGKTTTIHILAGLLKPDSGSVSVNGAADPTRAEVRRQIGIAPQALALYEDMSAEANLRFLGELYGLAGAKLKERAEFALNLAGLVERRKDKVGTFSGGMKRRLNLAAALIHDPPVIFLDEPTVGVDPQSRNHLFANIEELAKQGRTILYTTHYMEEAQRLCHRVAIMDHGKILALDTVPELIQKHGGTAVIEGEMAEQEEREAGQRRLNDAIGRIVVAGSPDPATLHFEGHKFRRESSQPMEDVAKLAQAGVKLAALHVDRPDLEAVFLNLTGRRLRD